MVVPTEGNEVWVGGESKVVTIVSKRVVRNCEFVGRRFEEFESVLVELALGHSCRSVDVHESESEVLLSDGIEVDFEEALRNEGAGGGIVGGLSSLVEGAILARGRVSRVGDRDGLSSGDPLDIGCGEEDVDGAGGGKDRSGGHVQLNRQGLSVQNVAVCDCSLNNFKISRSCSTWSCVYYLFSCGHSVAISIIFIDSDHDEIVAGNITIFREINVINIDVNVHSSTYRTFSIPDYKLPPSIK